MFQTAQLTGRQLDFFDSFAHASESALMVALSLDRCILILDAFGDLFAVVRRDGTLVPVADAAVQEIEASPLARVGVEE